MANKEFMKNNETLSPRHVAPKILGDFNTLRDFLEHHIRQGGNNVKEIAKGENISLEDMLKENSKIPGVVDNADLVVSGIVHKINLSYVTCPTTKRKILLGLTEKQSTNNLLNGGKPLTGKSTVKKSIIKNCSISNDLEKLNLEEEYNETYGGKKKKPHK